MKEKINLSNYGVQEMTIAETKEVNGGIIPVIIIWAIAGAAAGAVVDSAKTAFREGQRQACPCCF